MVEKPEDEKPFERTGWIWENNMNMDFTEVSKRPRIPVYLKKYRYNSVPTDIYVIRVIILYNKLILLSSYSFTVRNVIQRNMLSLNIMIASINKTGLSLNSDNRNILCLTEPRPRDPRHSWCWNIRKQASRG